MNATDMPEIDRLLANAAGNPPSGAGIARCAEDRSVPPGGAGWRATRAYEAALVMLVAANCAGILVVINRSYSAVGWIVILFVAALGLIAVGDRLGVRPE